MAQGELAVSYHRAALANTRYSDSDDGTDHCNNTSITSAMLCGGGRFAQFARATRGHVLSLCLLGLQSRDREMHLA